MADMQVKPQLINHVASFESCVNNDLKKSSIICFSLPRPNIKLYTWKRKLFSIHTFFFKSPDKLWCK